ncbi:Ig-like domain-containing protein [Treponema vincentii]|uniref:Ig-like domain-containing protein n=1 Tax=Treponema vincentii TaxID=69710 RepID=UPI0020A586A1|nr:Ig-like domain-containing protein [Treponema vincentii]UTC47733.1 Ig-like domain-containing protein [Treponema vincentii]
MMKHYITPFWKALILMLAVLQAGACSLFMKPAQPQPGIIELDQMEWEKPMLQMKVGGMEHIKLIASPREKQRDAPITFEYDETVIKLINNNYGVVIEALKAGRTVLTARNGSLSTNLVITVDGYAEGYSRPPYIYSQAKVLTLKPAVQERISVSLYGGQVEDGGQFSWKSENPSVAEVIPNGQFALIETKGEGNTRITVTHPKAEHPYTVLVYVFADNQKPTFITTQENVVTLQKDKGERTITVDIENPQGTVNPAGYSWTLITKDNKAPCVKLESNGNKAVLTPLEAGSTLLQVSHPQSVYPLEILVRTVEIVKNVHIELTKTYVELSGEAKETITAELKGLPADSSSYDTNAFVWNIEENTCLEALSHANQLYLSGKANGIVRISVSHPQSAYPRELFVSLINQQADALDASRYITTTQNFIRTKVNAEPISLDVQLFGGDDGDERDFLWTVSGKDSDGSKADIIKLETPTGTSISRAAAPTYAFGKALITPLKEGTATISITHKKVRYPTDILVKVLPSYAVLNDPLYFTGSSLETLLNGTEKDISVHLTGTMKKESDNEKISWQSSNDAALSITASGEQAHIRATGHGNTVSFITVNHPKAEENKKITVLSADSEEDLKTMKVLYADKYSYGLKVKTDTEAFISCYGLSESEIEALIWTVQDERIISLENPTNEQTHKVQRTMAKLHALKAGSTTVTVSVKNTPAIKPVKLTVTVYPENADLSVQGQAPYLTTGHNVLVLSKPGQGGTLEVRPIALAEAKHQSIAWQLEKTGIIDIAPNGASAHVTALQEGETKVLVSHPESQNTLTLYVKVGSEYIYNNPKTAFISLSTDTIALVKDAKPFSLKATLTNAGDVQGGFSFSIDKGEIASLSSTDDGTCLVTPVKAGQAQIEVKNTHCTLPRKVLVLVANSPEELKGLTYLTTNTNVVTVYKGQNKNLSVAIRNSEDSILDGFSWESANKEIATVEQSSGANAVIHGNEVGTTRLTVSNTHCTYPLEIIVQCADPILAKNHPYIDTPANIVPLVVTSGAPTGWQTITASLEGGTEEDKQNFSWAIEDSAIAQMYGQGPLCKVRALLAGSTRIVIRHPKAEDPCYVLLLCDAAPKTNCSISVRESIITMKPSEGDKTITATLINGTLEDKYAFKWWADTYDVISLNYSANIASIRPIGEGETTIHITHPKAPYEQEIKVTVSEYTEFAFAADFITLTEGKTQFLSMKVPSSSVKTHIEYSSENPALCMAEGTNKTAQLTALKQGSTKVKARLIATKTNIVQAEAEILVTVEKADPDMVYITSSKTVYMIEQGTTQTITANIQGKMITPVDVQNLQWKSSNPAVVKLAAASSTGVSTGPEAVLQAVGQGECTVTISHEKAHSQLVLKIIVPGKDKQEVTLNKTYIRLETGSQTEVKASISGANPNDYKMIEWSVAKYNGETIANVLGKGQTVAVYAVKPGKSALRATLPNGSVAECEILVEASRDLQFSVQSIRVAPGASRSFTYLVSPSDVTVDWRADSEDAFSYSVDTVKKEITITGNAEGSGILTGVTQYGNKASIRIVCSWDYTFTIGKSAIVSEPEIDPARPDDFVIPYTVIPNDAVLEINCDTDIVGFIVDKEQKKIFITPKKEGNTTLAIIAKNPHKDDFPFATRSCAIKLRYSSINLAAHVVDKTGNFSRIDTAASRITIGDGEDFTFRITADKPNADIAVTNATFNPAQESQVTLKEDANGASNVYTLSHPTDYLEYRYLIDKDVKCKLNLWYYQVTHDDDGGGHDYIPTDNWVDCANIGWRSFSTEYKDAILNTTGRKGMNFYGINNIGYEIKLDSTQEYGSFNNEYYFKQREDSKLGELTKFETTPCTPYYVLEEEFKRNGLWYKPPIQYENTIVKQVGFWPWDTQYVHDSYDDHPEQNLHNFQRFPVVSKEIKTNNFAGNLTVTYTRFGRTESRKIPVYFEQRACAKN